eukprot:scaffold4237_cov71-Phaeocystis_antarctica.AAC.4
MPEHSRNAPRQAASAQAIQPGVVESAAHLPRQLVATQWDWFPAHSAQSALSELSRHCVAQAGLAYVLNPHVSPQLVTSAVQAELLA